VNIAQTLAQTARQFPDQRAVVVPHRRDPRGASQNRSITFRQLDELSGRMARGLQRRGAGPGRRLVLMVRPGIEFIALTYAVFKTGAVVVLIDPGMGRRALLRCLDEVDPDGILGVWQAQAARWWYRRRFPQARLNVAVGPGLKFGAISLQELASDSSEPLAPVERGDRDHAAIIFTSGSTGPAKGVLYEHGMFAAQVRMIRDFYGIEPGGIDLSGFPLFALFNAAMGVTTVVPRMDPSHPAKVDPALWLETIRDQQVTQSFGSPAIWNRVGRYCERHGVLIPYLSRVLSAGAPVPVHVVERMSRALESPGAELHTPYGATEALPVCSLSSTEILAETAARSRLGAGTCVGRPFPEVELRVVEMVDGPLEGEHQLRELPRGAIGEIVVRSPSGTREYFRNPEATRRAKVPAADGRPWHRMGDVGYLDAEGRLWFCGRCAHVVEAAAGRMFPVCCEAVFNQHPRVFRTALVGVGERGRQRPVLVVEPEAGHFPSSRRAAAELRDELLALGAEHELTRTIRDVLIHPALPVDVRHNVKIDRERLAVWAARRLTKRPVPC